VRSPLRIATTVLGVFFALQGLLWIADPVRAAAGLGMPLLDGLARSTQIGDFGAFFLTIGATMVVGAGPGRARLLFVPAGMLGAAAVVRTLAWGLHDSTFAGAFIAIEVAVAALLLVVARRHDAQR